MVMTNQFDLSGKSLQAFSEDSIMVDAETMGKVERVTEYLNEVVKFIKKFSLPSELQGLEESEATAKLEPKELKKYLKVIEYLKKVHVPVIYNTAVKAILNDVSVKDFAKFIAKFFFDVPARYKRFVESDTTSSASVKIRLEEMDKALVNEFKIVAKVTEVKEAEVVEIQQEEEQPQQTENLEPAITATLESFSEENKEEQPEEAINDEQEQDQEFQEETQAILNIVNNVA